MENVIKGALYEKFVLSQIKHEAWLWKFIPYQHLLDAGLVHDLNEHRAKKVTQENTLIDIGVDILEYDNDKYIFSQCKNYKKAIGINDIGGFSYMLMNHPDKLGKLYYTSKLSIHIRENCINKRVEYIHLPFNETTSHDNKITNAYKLFDYQKQAVKSLKKHFKNNNRGILSMPCGTGKTITSSFFALNYTDIVILSPLKQFAEQNLNRFLEYHPELKGMVVDSDHSRDIDKIRSFIQSTDGQESVISMTYKSVDLLQDILESLSDDLIIIVDEFHNLAYGNLTDEDDDFYKILHSDYNILFMSATPRVFELEKNEDQDEYLEIFGETVYNMDFMTAINDNLICDFKVYVPSVSCNNKKVLKKINKEIKCDMINEQMEAKVNYIINGILDTGCTKTIVYLKSHEEIKAFKKCFKKHMAYHGEEFWISSITSDVSLKNRNKILDEFQRSDIRAILCSVYILDECIDIPACDSIFITSCGNNKVRTVQRLSRCLRKYGNKKYGHCFLWCDEYSELTDTLSAIKECALEFDTKVRVVDGDIYEEKNEENNEKIKKDLVSIKKVVVGVKEFKIMSWFEKYDLLVKYIEENNKIPSVTDKNKNIKKLGLWMRCQLSNYKEEKYIMKNEEIYNKWAEFQDQYADYLKSFDEIWLDNYNSLIKYIEENKKTPSAADKNKDIKKLARWLSVQKNYYANKIKSMKNPEIYDRWTNFNNEYGDYLKSNEEIWFDNLGLIVKYINENNKTPSSVDKNKDVKKLGLWLLTQKENCREGKYLMKNPEIYNKWKEFYDKYSNYLKPREEIWFDNYNSVIQYIEENKKRPSVADKNKDIQKLSIWLSIQKRYCKNKVGSFKNPEIYNKWIEFCNQYADYLKSFDEIWLDNYNSLIEYIEENKKTPSAADKNKDIRKLGKWLSEQKKCCKDKIKSMKNPENRKKWEELIDTYPELF